MTSRKDPGIEPIRARRAGGGGERGPCDYARAVTATSHAALRRRRGPWVLALGAYGVVLALVLGWPTPVDAPARGGLDRTLAALHAAGMPGWVDYAFVERAANVALFVPLGLLVTVVVAVLAPVSHPQSDPQPDPVPDPRLAPHRWWWGLVVPALVSAGAEAGQAAAHPDRVATVADVAANAAGGALGVALALAVSARLRQGRPSAR